jgi:hypothetical protein
MKVFAPFELNLFNLAIALTFKVQIHSVAIAFNCTGNSMLFRAKLVQFSAQYIQGNHRLKT